MCVVFVYQTHVIEGALRCDHCGRSYPIQQGIPNMRLNEDEVCIFDLLAQYLLTYMSLTHALSVCLPVCLSVCLPLSLLLCMQVQ
jgi:hypothetical protein